MPGCAKIVHRAAFAEDAHAEIIDAYRSLGDQTRVADVEVLTAAWVGWAAAADDLLPH